MKRTHFDGADATVCGKIVTALVIALLAPSIAFGFSAEPYLPLQHGNAWRFTTNGTDTTTRTVTGSEVVDQYETRAVASAPDLKTEYVSNDGSGIRVHGTYSPSVYMTGCGYVATTATFFPARLLVPADVTIGGSYRSSGLVTQAASGCATTSGNYSAESSVIGTESVSVPLGTFLALKVVVDLKIFSDGTLSSSQRSTYWLAPEVGVIKQIEGESGPETYLTATSMARSTPDPLAFGAVNGVVPGTDVISEAVTITGTTRPSIISVVGGSYRIDNGPWTGAPGNVWNGQKVEVRATAPSTYNNTTTATLTVGGISAGFVLSSLLAAPPDAPAGVSALPSNQAALVTFTAPQNDGGAPITSYTVTANPGGITASGTASPIRVTGLSNGTRYSFTVRAQNSLGDSLASAASKAVAPRPAVHHDLGGNGRADILWRHEAAISSALWRLNGTSSDAAAAMIAIVTDMKWQVAATGDFNGDGKVDILWRHTRTGDSAIWLMNGSTLTASATVPTVVDESWVVVGAGDFDGDGKADILWRNITTGDNAIWLMNGDRIETSAMMPRVADVAWAIEGVIDFDADGRVDLLWRNKLTGQTAIWLMDGSTLVASKLIDTLSREWKIAGVADYNGDGKGDILLRNPVTGENAMWLMNGLSRLANQPIDSLPDPNWIVAGVGDYDGDLKADILWRNSSTGESAVWLMDGLRMRSRASPVRTPRANWAVVRK